MGPLLICSNPQTPGGTKSSILEQFSQTVSVLCSDTILISAYRILHLLHKALHICFVGICKFSCYYKKQEKLEIFSLERNRWGIFLLQFVITIRLLGTMKHKVQRKRRIHLYLSSLPREATCGHTALSLACLAEAITILWAAKGNHLASLTRSAKSLPLIIPLKLPLARLLW